ncbi:hypothetical protein BaRGS_00007356, partial [Batillaria attramentaria]
PVTPEELEKASKISPLAMSLVKPPDPELLKGLPLKDQQELMMLHAEATLSQCSSRSNSRPSSQPGSRRGSFTTPDTLAASAENVSVKASEKSSSTTAITSSTETSATTTTSTTSVKKQASVDLPRTDSEPRGILKKTKSTESVPSDSTFKVIQQEETVTVTAIETSCITGSQEVTQTSRITGSQEVTQTSRITGSQEVTQTSRITASQDAPAKKSAEPEGDRSSPVAELILPKATDVAADVGKSMFYLDSDDLAGESSTDPAESDNNATADADSKRRSRFAGRKEQKE